MRAILQAQVEESPKVTKIDLVYSSIFDLFPDVYYQIGQLLLELEKSSPDAVEINFLVNTYQCYKCSSTVKEKDCIIDGKYCLFQPILPENASNAPGSDLLDLSLRMECLTDVSKPTEKVKTFFRYIEVFYEKACMIYADLDRFKMNLDTTCARNVIKLLTLTPTKVETCFSDSFTVGQDRYTDNLTLKDHAEKIKVLNTHYQNPNLFIDGEPYHQPLYRDEKFKES